MMYGINWPLNTNGSLTKMNFTWEGFKVFLSYAFLLGAGLFAFVGCILVAAGKLKGSHD